ncbi:universal stress protein [Lentilactobacillus raoultii]|uniref:Universal stress protein n=1 Tax=Lentilactobacillus raoultii TaxID=1987503 RepID=A0ABW3PPL2_9LACO|nr:universal stress protein [Lentilactobacillus raoultii]
MAYKRILVGLDGSKQADRAFRVGCELAKILSASLYVVWVVNRDRGMDSTFGVSEDFYQDLYRQVKEKIKPYIKRGEEQGIHINGNVIIGSIKTVLAKDFPAEHHIDLIIVGNTGVNAVTKMIQGSHTGYVARQSTCDVLIVK